MMRDVTSGLRVAITSLLVFAQFASANLVAPPQFNRR